MARRSALATAQRRMFDVTDGIVGFAGDTRERAADLSDELRRRSTDAARRAGELPGHVDRTRERARERIADLEPVARQTGIGALGVLQAVLAVVLAVPRMVVRALAVTRVLSERAEYAADRGHELAERARELVHDVEPSRRDRRRRRIRALALVCGGFGAGFVAGWIAGDARGLAAQAEARERAEVHARHLARVDADDRALGIGTIIGTEPDRDSSGMGSVDEPERARTRDGAGSGPTGNGPRTGPTGGPRTR